MKNKQTDQWSEESIRKLIDSSPFARKLGIQFHEIRPGYAEASLTVEDWMLNLFGMTHGGLVFSLADSVFGAAGNAYGLVSLAIHADISYLQPTATGSVLTARAVEESRSRRVTHYRVAVEDETGRLIATFHGVGYIKKDPLPLDK